LLKRRRSTDRWVVRFGSTRAKFFRTSACENWTQLFNSSNSDVETSADREKIVDHETIEDAGHAATMVTEAEIAAETVVVELLTAHEPLRQPMLNQQKKEELANVDAQAS
jgi:hypothetical protein